jgi:hypothetical protein
VAGSADGEAGFRDGAASESLFNAPVSIALAEEDGKTYVFVSDVGNKRIRRIDLSARTETTRVPPPATEVPPFRLPGPGDEPLSPLDAVNYLIAWVYGRNAAQYTADATDAIFALDDGFLAEGESKSGIAWDFGLQLKNVKPDISLGSPPGSRRGATVSPWQRRSWGLGAVARN